MSLEESIALVETLAEKNIKGAEAGTKIRNILTKIAAAEALPKEAIIRAEALGVNLELVGE